MNYYDENDGNWKDIRQSSEYKLRKKHLRDAWTLLLIALLSCPPAAQVSIALFAVFISFSYLDEVPYKTS